MQSSQSKTYVSQPSSYWKTASEKFRYDEESENIAFLESDTVQTPKIKYNLKLGLKGWIVRQTIISGDKAGGMEAEDDDLSLRNSRHADHVDRSHASASSEQEQAINSLAHLKNPEIENSNQLFATGLESLYTRLQVNHIRPEKFPINTFSQILNFTFSRKHLSAVYGGSIIDTFPKVNPAKTNIHYHSRFMCLNPVYNPHCPQQPGAPGLFYALRDSLRWPKEEETAVFVRYRPNNWNYLGEYKAIKAEPLSALEFKGLDKSVQETWFNNIWHYKWGNHTIAAIYLRRVKHREPSDQEIQSYSKRKAALIRKKVSHKDVQQAFFSGKERVNVWVLKPISYNEQFKRALVPAGLIAMSTHNRLTR